MAAKTSTSAEATVRRPAVCAHLEPGQTRAQHFQAYTHSPAVHKVQAPDVGAPPDMQRCAGSSVALAHCRTHSSARSLTSPPSQAASEHRAPAVRANGGARATRPATSATRVGTPCGIEHAARH